MKTNTSQVRIQKVVKALHKYADTLSEQYSKRVHRMAEKIAEEGRLFAFRKGGYPTLGTLKNALRSAR